MLQFCNHQAMWILPHLLYPWDRLWHKLVPATYPLVNLYRATENCHFYMGKLIISTAIFHSSIISDCWCLLSMFRVSRPATHRSIDPAEPHSISSLRDGGVGGDCHRPSWAKWVKKGANHSKTQPLWWANKWKTSWSSYPLYRSILGGSSHLVSKL